MAVLKKGSLDMILKEIKGRVGDFYISQRKGKTVISRMPRKRKKLKLTEQTSAQRKFRTISIFSAFVKNIPEISAIWKSSKIPGSPVRQLMKCNSKAVGRDHPEPGCTITPPGFQFRIMDVILLEDQIYISMEDWYQTDPGDQCLMIMSLHDPVDEKDKPFELINISPADTVDLEISLNQEQVILAGRYKTFILYTAVYRLNGNALQWSNTYSVKGEIE